jgi:hypothetical protein
MALLYSSAVRLTHFRSGALEDAADSGMHVDLQGRMKARAVTWHEEVVLTALVS